MSWSQYEAPNLGLLFYRHIYKEDFVKQKLQFNDDGELIIKVTKDDKPNPFNSFYDVLYNKPLKEFHRIENSLASDKFLLKTTYPGLLCGSGYAHDTGAMGDFKIGFFFDHTTGQPIIPGSSVKGICRSIFESDFDKELKKRVTGEKSFFAVRFICKEFIERAEKSKDEDLKKLIVYFQSILSTLPVSEINNREIPDDFATSKKKLENIVFQMFGKDKTKGNDIFFDAVLDIAPNNSKPFLANDFITPHIDREHPELSPFKNPNPIQFLKVRSEVPFEFRFKLTDFDELWTKEVKFEFFKQILLTLGIGAKTNVGYGQFETHIPNKNDSNGAEKEKLSQQNKPKSDKHVAYNQVIPTQNHEIKEKSRELNLTQIIDVQITKTWKDLAVGAIVEGELISYNNGNSNVLITLERKKIELNFQGKQPAQKNLLLKVLETSGKFEKGNLAITRVCLYDPK